MNKTRVSKSSEPPWWLAPGSAVCEYCLRTYHCEAGYYCVVCDQPVCPLCMTEIHVTRTCLCPACHTEDN